MDIGPRPVEQSDDTGIDMPSFVGLRGADADGRFRGMKVVARTPPAVLADELGPGTVAPLGDGELARAGAGTRRAIVEGAGCRGVARGMVASRFEAENPEDQAKRQPWPGTLDGAENVRRRGTLRQSSAVEVELGHSKQSQ